MRGAVIVEDAQVHLLIVVVLEAGAAEVLWLGFGGAYRMTERPSKASRQVWG